MHHLMVYSPGTEDHDLENAIRIKSDKTCGKRECQGMNVDMVFNTNQM